MPNLIGLYLGNLSNLPQRSSLHSHPRCRRGRCRAAVFVEDVQSRSSLDPKMLRGWGRRTSLVVTGGHDGPRRWKRWNHGTRLLPGQEKGSFSGRWALEGGCCWTEGTMVLVTER